MITRLAATLLGGLFALANSAPATAQDFSISVLKFGTVNWELNTIKSRGLDEKNAFSLEINHTTSSTASRVALQAGEVDAIVADWLWAARERDAGADFVFIPYSKSVGGLVVPGDSEVSSLSDIKSKSIGIAGGPLDKSWLIFQAYAAQEHNLDLAGATRQQFGAPPLIFNAGLQGQTDATINFWHFLAKMKASGFRTVISVDQAAQSLGLDPDLPLLGYVVRGEVLRAHPEIVDGFVRASREAKAILKTDDTAWAALRPKMNAANDAQFAALVDGFRAGIPESFAMDTAKAAAFLDVMVQAGGAKLVGGMQALPDGLFYPGAR